MENNFQRVGSISNAHVGREFEEAAVIAEVFNKTTRTTLPGAGNLLEAFEDVRRQHMKEHKDEESKA
jgi:hypothetical protein